MSTVFLQAGWGPGHMTGWGGWVWLGMAVFWLAVVGLIAWMIVRGSAARPRGPSGSAEEVLAQRFARGEIDVDEYRERLDELRR